MKYSIIIPTYNHADLLKQCLDSIKATVNLDETEIIVVANGCTDNTKEVAEGCKLYWSDQALGYPRAINKGLEISTGDYIVLLNNDTVLLANNWLDILVTPFTDQNTGITGPLKFTWQSGSMKWECMAFWCVMLKRQLLNDVGYLDETFSPGMGEDGDYCCRTMTSGYNLVQVPVDGSHEFGNGTGLEQFPIYHVGNGTFGDNHDLKNEVIKRNTEIVHNRYSNPLDVAYNFCWLHPGDCSEHFPIFKKYASECIHVTEFGVRDVYSTVAFLAARPKVMRSYDIYESGNIGTAYMLASHGSIDFKFQKANTIELVIEPTDMLFIDTKHTYQQLITELTMHHDKVHKYIIMHDVETFGQVGEDGSVGLLPAIHEFIGQHQEWTIKEHFTNSNGLMILARSNPRVSIVIPTYNHLDDLLKPCIESIIKFTDLEQTEVIIVANGCTDGTRDYVLSLGIKFRLLWSDEALGYTRATNLGIQAANGDYVVLLNNDTVILPQPKNLWIKMLEEPFVDQKVGITGPLQLFDTYAGRPVLIFFCVMISKRLISEIGLLDESYSPGGGEDIDYTIRAEEHGYKCLRVPVTEVQGFDNELKTNIGSFPIYHKGEGTFDHIPEYGKTIIKANGLKNMKKYNQHIKLNLGAGPVEVPGYMSVDLYDDKASIIMDVCKLDFNDNTVEEILASHLVEHISPYKVLDMFKEWYRILKPGGRLVIELPHIIELCKHILEGNKDQRYGLLNCVYGAVRTQEGDRSDIVTPHLWGWYPEILADHLFGAGFKNIIELPEQIPHPGYNFRMECVK